MYYNRTVSDSFSSLLEPEGKLRWLFEYVKKRPDLDFLIGRNNAEQWISVYRGLSRVLKITLGKNPGFIKLSGADAYVKIREDMYGERSIHENFLNKLDSLVKYVSSVPDFDRYYSNRKEGYYQNELSRNFGICGNSDTDFVIVDKEVCVGYENQREKDLIYGEIRKDYIAIKKGISRYNPKRYGQNLEEKPIGGELDFLAIDKNGNLLLIEYKHGTNTSGIYLSPLQIGMYYELFCQLPKTELFDAAYEMIEQKQKIGLINPEWRVPKIKNLIPVLVISEYNYRASAKVKYDEIIDFVRERKGSGFLQNIELYNYTPEKGLSVW